jgi:phage pi2 protein 07
MNVRDINILKRSERNENLYDLTKLTYRTTFEEVNFSAYKVQKGEEMRIDLVCQSIYGNVNNIDVILNFNNISNPLNIKEGTILYYPDQESLDKFNINETTVENVQQKISTAGKATAVDPDRKAYVEQNYSLPPTVLDRPTEQVTLTGDTIQVQGLFNK